MRSDHCHLTAYQIGCEVGQSIGLVLRPAIFDRQILALDVTTFADASLERGHKVCTVGRRRAAEEPDHRHRRLLCARRERPRGCRAANQQDEVASLHCLMLPVLPTGRIAHSATAGDLLHCGISKEPSSAVGQNAKSLLNLAFPLPPGADMPLQWLRSESCHKRL